MTTDELLAEREKTHGPYNLKAETIQDLKEVMRARAGWARLTPGQQEALDMIQHKIGRILTGDPHHPDHWDDLEGYSRLGKRSCK